MATLPPRLASRYLPIDRLGEGGFAQVVRARDRELERDVALKLVPLPPGSPELAARVRREARVTSRLQHPGVVRVFDHEVDAAASLAWVVYELVEGTDLGKRIEGRGPLSPVEVRRLGAELAAALEVVHQAGVVHRDVKPPNVLLRADGSPVLCDFGLAADAAAATLLTQPGWVVGTPGYLAPEVLQGEAPGPQSDQYALAATLWEALTGEAAVPGNTLPEMLTAAVAGARRPPPEALVAADPALVSTLRRAMAPALRARFRSCQALARALEVPSTASPRGASSVSARERGLTRRLSGRSPARRNTPMRVRAPSGRRRAGVVFGLAAAVGFALTLGPLRGPTSPSPPPVATPPTPSASAQLPEEAPVSMEELLLEIARPHLPGPDTPVAQVWSWGNADHSLAAEPELLGPDFLVRLRRVLDAAVERAAAPGDRAVRDEPLRVATLALLHHFRRDLRHALYENRRGVLFGRVSVQRLGRVEAQLLALREEAFRTSSLLVARTGGRPSAVALAARIRVGFAETGDSTMLREEQARLETVLEGRVPIPARVDLHESALEVSHDLGRHGLIPCLSMEATMESARRDVERVEADAREADRLRLHVFTTYGRGVEVCGDGFGEPILVWLGEVASSWLRRAGGPPEGAPNEARELLTRLEGAGTRLRQVASASLEELAALP